ncbi:lytic transglycosylase domain-containing protein [Pseudomonas sp.]|uniref:lytic transglycosylase domain-containing protein n=1 Tax=Pseudomonas sp. TaxID=306 RepID=UPI00299D708F|nr:lytic transglycosylase domain-containing protein [Pseudomonas sp.]MDX1370405.1 lytic transglycosylase domain-containing protein [Pseudomonas sp.]
MRLSVLCLLVAVVAIFAPSVRADIYRAVAADGSVMLTNVYREGRNYVRVHREAATLSAPASKRQTVARERPFVELVMAAAAEHDLPEALLHAVIQAESNYNPMALSKSGAAGLMQLMPATARELGVDDVWDPESNIRGGARYLKRLLGMFDNDLSLALAAYNAGPTAVINRGKVIPPYAETLRYVPKVIEHYQRLQAGEPATLL